MMIKKVQVNLVILTAHAKALKWIEQQNTPSPEMNVRCAQSVQAQGIMQKKIYIQVKFQKVFS